MATVDTNIDLIASILNPASTQLREEQLRVSEQNRRVQQAESRRADRDQQLQEILAPLQSRRLSQELQLNALKLEEADRVAQTRISDEGARAELMDLFGRAAQSNFDNEVVSEALERMKRHSRVLSDRNSALFGLDQTLIGETVKARQKEAEIDKSLEVQRLMTERSEAIQKSIGQRTATTQQAITDRTLQKEAMEQEFEREMSQLDNETKLTIAQIRSDLRGGVRKQMAQVDFIAQLAPKIVAASFGRKTMKEAEDEALAIYKRHSPLLEEDAVLGTRVPRTGVAQPRRIKVIRVDENGVEQRGTVSESSLAEALRQGYRISE